MTILTRCLALALGVSFWPALAQPLGSNGSVIDDARWNKRLLLICGQSDAALGSTLQKAQFELADWIGYLERDLMVVGVSVGTSIIFDTASFANDDANPAVHIWNDGDKKLESKADCESGKASVSLVGKDGQTKASWEKAVTSEELFAFIDAMPMRQTEMRHAGD